MADRIRLVLLYGGKTQEHEVSLCSAASVIQHLNSERYEIIPVAIDKSGMCYLHQKETLLGYDKLPVVTADAVPLDSLICQGRLFTNAEVVFPVMHGTLYEDGCLQGLLQWANVAVVGSDVLGSALGMDKDMARRVACDQEIPSARYRLVSGYTTANERQRVCEEAARSLKWPLFVKPCSLGSSVGIHKVTSHEALLTALDDALCYDKEALIEECIVGREIELAVLENRALFGPPRVSIAGEIRVHHPHGFYSYSAKYLESEQTELFIPAQLDDGLLQRLQSAAAAVFTRLKCRGMARVDFFVQDQTSALYFSEINTLPGFTAISMYPKLWEASGLSYSNLLDELVDIALAHHQNHQRLVTSYL